MSKTAELDVALKGAIEKVGQAVDLKEVLASLAPEPERVPAPTQVPLPAKITDEEREALDKVHLVFGAVVPSERRVLEPLETRALLEERDVLKTLEKMATNRQKDIRTIVFNHLDVLVEEAGIEDAEYDKDGHYVVAGEVEVEGATTKFVRQISERSPSLDANRLKELVDDPDVDFAHEDYLAVTTQTRVVDENKLMLELKKRPELLGAIREATKPGGKSAALYQRKR